MIHTTRKITIALTLAVLTIGLTGCQTAHVAKPLTANMAGNSVDQQMDFWHTLAERKLTSNDEAFHAILLYVNQKDDSKSYDGRVAAMKQQQMIPADFNEPADDAVTRGTLSVAICKILDIKGGVIMHVFGPSPRYATRELAYLGVFPESSPQQTFSGDQFVSIVGRIEDYQRQKPFEKSGGNAQSQPALAATPAQAPQQNNAVAAK